MKRLTFFVLIFIVTSFLGFSMASEDREVARTQDYIAATTKQGPAKIAALQAYIKKFPNTKQKWTRYAYYSLAAEYFQVKNYAEAAKYAKKTLEIGAPGTGGEEGRLYLITANSYGIRGEAIFNQELALQYTDKAIALATAKGLNDVLKQAKNLKKSLSGPPPVKLTPEQKIKRAYSNEEYGEVISVYRGLAAADKENAELRKVYANALFKKRNYDDALKEFQALYGQEKTGSYASRMADIYAAKAKKDKKFYDMAVNFYLDASLLYQKEQYPSNQKASFGKARYNLYEKYGFNKKIEAYNKKTKNSQSAAKKNEAEIDRLKRALRKHKRDLRRNYERQGMDPPGYEIEKGEKMKKQIAALESGETAESSDEGAKLKEERERIEKELNDALAKAKTRING